MLLRTDRCYLVKIDPATGASLGKVDMLKNGEAARVRVKPVTPLVIELQKEFPQLARFAIRDSGRTVAAGMCIEIVKKTTAEGKKETGAKKK